MILDNVNPNDLSQLKKGSVGIARNNRYHLKVRMN